MSDFIRLVNQQAAFCHAHVHSARTGDAFSQRCNLQACKLQMHVLMHAYIAEIAQRHNVKWQLSLGDINHALETLQAQFEEKNLVSADLTQLQELLCKHSLWRHWLLLSQSIFNTGAQTPLSPLLSDITAVSSSPIIASSQTVENRLNTDPHTQIELMHELLSELDEVIHTQRENKIEF